MSLKVTLFFNSGAGGFTETYFASGSNPQTFINSLPNSFYNAAIALRAAPCVMWGIRASNIGSPKLVYSVPLGSKVVASDDNFGPDNPDVLSTDAVIRIYTQGGQSSTHFLRGLYDSSTVLSTAGNSQLGATLQKQINQYLNQLSLAGFQLRFGNRPPVGGLTWFPVISLNPAVAGGPYTNVVTQNQTSFDNTDPPYLLFQGVPKNDVPGFPTQTHFFGQATASPFGVTVPYRYRAATNPYYPEKMRFCLLQYTYVNLPPTSTSNPQWEFIKFSEHKTGRAFGVSRGRARSLVKRQ